MSLTRTVLPLIGLLLFPVCGFAHPFHTSTAEMEWNSKTQRFEVSVKIHAVDIERALSRKSGRRISLEGKAEVTKLVREYLSQHFFIAEQQTLQDSKLDREKPQASEKHGENDGKEAGEQVEPLRSKLKFVGRELETSWLWLYFELEPPQSDMSWVLANTLLFDVTDGQINTITVRRGDKRFSMKTTVKKPVVEFSRAYKINSAPSTPQ